MTTEILLQMVALKNTLNAMGNMCDARYQNYPSQIVELINKCIDVTVDIVMESDDTQTE